MLDSLRQTTPGAIEKEPFFVDAHTLNPSVTVDPAFSGKHPIPHLILVYVIDVSFPVGGGVFKILVSPDKSIMEASRSGHVDTDTHRILRRIGASADKVQVYDRMYPPLLLRHLPSATSVAVPNVTQENKPELLLGTQT